MRHGRDRLVAAAAMAILAVLAAMIAALVLDAQQAGVDSREEFRQREVQRLANALDTRVQQVFAYQVGQYGTPGMWRMTPSDPADARLLVPLSQNGTGAFLVDRQGVVLNGPLLRDRSMVGRRYEAEGLERALQGEPTLLGVMEGLTTTGPVIGVATPVHAANGRLAGVHVAESPATANSAFAAEVAQLGDDDGGDYTYVDETDTIAASSDPARHGRRSTFPKAALGAGFHRIDGRVYAAADVPSARWHLVFDQSTGDFEGDLTGPVRRALYVLLTAVVVAGTLSVIALLRRLGAAREEQRRLLDIASAREEFTSIVSHELRTPVAGMLGFLQTTVDHWDDMSDAERRQAVARAQQNADRLQRLTVDVLDSTGMETGRLPHEPAPIDLAALVEEEVATARSVHAGRTITVARTDGAVPVIADTTRIRQVLANLIENAAKSSPPESPVEVSVRVLDNAAEVAVRDHGSGIAAEDRTRIFDKFVRGRPGLTRGSGLGLYLAHQIVQAHGGRIWVDEPDGPGALVVFRLPAGDDRGR